MDQVDSRTAPVPSLKKKDYKSLFKEHRTKTKLSASRFANGDIFQNSWGKKRVLMVVGKKIAEVEGLVLST